VHANYLATTAKCGICHSVHRANALGTKLLPTANATCSGCHVGSTAITAKIITWQDVNLDWVPVYDADGVLVEDPAAGGGGGPHNDPVWDTVLPDLIETEGGPVYEYPAPSYDLEPFSRYGCATRRCHATNPHGAGGSQYKIFAAKLLFNDSPADDDLTNPDLAAAHGPGTYGRLDAKWDYLGATDAAVERFVDQNSSIMSTDTAGNIYINGELPDENETHALVAGLTCGRPSNPSTGEDECHAEAAYAIVDKGIEEARNHATGITRAPSGTPGRTAAYTTDNVGTEAYGWGGNDNRDLKTGHVAGTFAAVPGAASYAPINGCTSCHDQTDAANTVYGNFTFPHGQTATGATNLVAYDGSTGTMVRSRIWSGWAGYLGAQRTVTDAVSKAYDGQCLKCHRNATNDAGIGLTQ